MSLSNLQAKIGVTADGAFGPGTFKAGMEFYKLSPVRAAHFFAQTAHETGNFKAFSENLNYGAAGLRGIFGKYFPTDALAAEYERKPEKIANRVYGGRMGNGDEASGDGYKYRGRGFLHITGKEMYAKCGKALGIDLVKHPELLEKHDLALKASLWYWNARVKPFIKDFNDVSAVTRRVNGGLNALDDRTANFADYKKKLGIS